MALDAICLSAVLYELREVLTGGKIDKIHQPGKDEVAVFGTVWRVLRFGGCAAFTGQRDHVL